MSEDNKLTEAERQKILEEFKVDMRDLSAYTTAEVDVYAFLTQELDEEIKAMGQPFSVRCYPTPYIMKLGEQLTELKGKPHTINANYRKINYKGHKFAVGCNVNDEFAYFRGDLFDGKVKNFDFFDVKSRTLELKLKPTNIYKSLIGDYDDEEKTEL